ncbi:MAG: LLM class flavin-dependent oxidoreductase [Ilumatobacteraceae bacterium]
MKPSTRLPRRVVAATVGVLLTAGTAAAASGVLTTDRTWDRAEVEETATSVTDTSTPDTSTPDTSTPDSSVPDTSAPTDDTVTTDPVTTDAAEPTDTTVAQGPDATDPPRTGRAPWSHGHEKNMGNPASAPCRPRPTPPARRSRSTAPPCSTPRTPPVATTTPMTRRTTRRWTRTTTRATTMRATRAMAATTGVVRARAAARGTARLSPPAPRPPVRAGSLPGGTFGAHGTAARTRLLRLAAPSPPPNCCRSAGTPRRWASVVFLSERFNVKEAVTLSGVAAGCTTSLGITTGSPTRTPAIRSSRAYATTMHRITGGRFALGLGRGMDRMFDAYGLPRITTAAMEDFAGLMRRLWNGEVVMGHDGPAGRWPVLALDPDFREDIPLLMSAFGPQSLRLAGRAFDAVLLHTFFTDDTMRRCVDTVRTAAERAGAIRRRCVSGVASPSSATGCRRTCG